MLFRNLILFSVIFFASENVCCAELPACSNRVIQEVTKRSSCTVGDHGCWLTKGGMCTDYIQRKAGLPGKPLQLNRRVSPEKVRKGDVAQFNGRAHYSYVENVIKDKNGRPVSISVSEYNYGTCWVDRSTMVTDTYGKKTLRSGIPLDSVDGGFWRPNAR